MWPFYLVGFSAYTYTAGALEADILLRDLRAYSIFCGLIAFAIAVLTVTRALWLTGATNLSFEESDPDAIFAGFSLSEGLAANAGPAPERESPTANLPPSRVHDSARFRLRA